MWREFVYLLRNNFFQAVFKLYDKDSTGYLNGFELRQALNSAGYKLNNHMLNVLVHRYGSKNGQVAFDDFIMCAVRLKTMIGNTYLHVLQLIYTFW